VGASEWNVFSGLFSNWVFLAILAFIVIVQALIVQFGGTVFSTKPLSPAEWIYCILIGAGSLVMGAILRPISVPDLWCCAIQGMPHPIISVIKCSRNVHADRHLLEIEENIDSEDGAEELDQLERAAMIHSEEEVVGTSHNRHRYMPVGSPNFS